VVPFSRIVTPARGKPSAASVILPAILIPWAFKAPARNMPRKNIESNTLIRFFIDSLV
jgi:hypothetical protein